MYYCLTSKRAIGNFSQNISSYQRHSPVNVVSNGVNPLLTLHTSFRTIIAELDGSWTTGSLEWLDLQAHDDYGTDMSPYIHPACTAIITIARPTANGNFKATTFRISNIGVEEFKAKIISEYYNLTGLDYTDTSVKNNSYITNAVLIIHPKEDENDG
jgi:hypothetical protein